MINLIWYKDLVELVLRFIDIMIIKTICSIILYLSLCLPDQSSWSVKHDDRGCFTISQSQRCADCEQQELGWLHNADLGCVAHSHHPLSIGSRFRTLWPNSLSSAFPRVAIFFQSGNVSISGHQKPSNLFGKQKTLIVLDLDIWLQSCCLELMYFLVKRAV